MTALFDEVGAEGASDSAFGGGSEEPLA